MYLAPAQNEVPVKAAWVEPIANATIIKPMRHAFLSSFENKREKREAVATRRNSESDSEVSRQSVSQNKWNSNSGTKQSKTSNNNRRTNNTTTKQSTKAVWISLIH